MKMTSTRINFTNYYPQTDSGIQVFGIFYSYNRVKLLKKCLVSCSDLVNVYSITNLKFSGVATKRT